MIDNNTTMEKKLTCGLYFTNVYRKSPTTGAYESSSNPLPHNPY